MSSDSDSLDGSSFSLLFVQRQPCLSYGQEIKDNSWLATLREGKERAIWICPIASHATKTLMMRARREAAE
jgi:hypothetical protein